MIRKILSAWISESFNIGYAITDTNILVKWWLGKWTPVSQLNYALANFSQKGELSLVKLISRKGANIHYDDELSLRLASSDGHVNVVKFLYRKGANIHIRRDTAFRWACHYGHLSVVQFLVENGADISICFYDAICRACRNGHLNIVKFLVNNGANIRVYNDCPLRWACGEGHLNVVKFLVDNGANPNNIEAMAKAQSNGHENVINYLENARKLERLLRVVFNTCPYARHGYENLPTSNNM